MKKILYSMAIVFLLLWIKVFALSPAYEPDYSSFDTYAWSLELKHWYEIKNTDTWSMELLYQWKKVLEYTWERYKVEKIIQSSFTVKTKKWNYLINKDNVYLNGLFYASAQNSALLLYDGEYLSTPKGVFQFFSKRRLNQEQWIRENTIEALKIKDAEPYSFKVWSSSTTSDKDNVYNEWEIVQWLDWWSFELLRGYFKNEWSVYKSSPNLSSYGNKNYEIMKNLDTSTFESFWYWYTKDKNWVYHTYSVRKWSLFNEETALVQADTSTFEVVEPDTLSGPSNWIYGKDKNAIYFWVWKISTDTNFFHSYTRQLGKDSKNLYCFGKDVQWVDITTLEPVYTSADKKYLKYFKDKNSVYEIKEKECSKLWNLDGSTFEYLNTSYFKDSNTVYYGKKPIDADAATFQLIQVPDDIYNTTKFARDKNNTYIDWVSINYFDVDTFKLIGSNYYSDKNWVYYGRIIIKRTNNRGLGTVSPQEVDVQVTQIQGADISTFTILSKWTEWSQLMFGWKSIPTYAGDKNHVYEKWNIVTWVDPKTFNPKKKTSKTNSTTKNEPEETGECTTILSEAIPWYWWSEWICCTLNDDETSFKPLNNYLATTDTSVYWVWIFNSETLCRKLEIPSDSLEIIEPIVTISQWRKQFQYTDKNNSSIRWVSYYIRTNEWIYFSVPSSEVCESIEVSWTTNTYCGKPQWLYKVEWADNSSFVNLNNTYAKDKNFVYYWWKIVEGADASSFSIDVVDSNNSNKNHTSEVIGKDQKYVYKFGKKVEWISWKGFRIVWSMYIDNKNWVYILTNTWEINLLESIDPSSLQYNSELQVYWDINWVYLRVSRNEPLRVIEWANFKTLKLVQCSWEKKCIHYYKDNKNIYSRRTGQPIYGADPSTFKYFWSNVFARDLNSIYFWAEPLDLEVRKTIESGKNRINNSSDALISDWISFYKWNKKITDFDLYHIYQQQAKRHIFTPENYKEYLKITWFDMSKFGSLESVSEENAKMFLTKWFSQQSTKNKLRDIFTERQQTEWILQASEDIKSAKDLLAQSIIDELQKVNELKVFLEAVWYDITKVSRPEEEVTEELKAVYNKAFDDFITCESSLRESQREEFNEKAKRNYWMLWMILDYNELLWYRGNGNYTTRTPTWQKPCAITKKYPTQMRRDATITKEYIQGKWYSFSRDTIDSDIKELHFYADTKLITTIWYEEESYLLTFEDIAYYDTFVHTTQKNSYTSLKVKAYTKNNWYYPTYKSEAWWNFRRAAGIR